MDEWITKTRRRKTPWVIGTLMVASLALLVILQSTNLWKTFNIDSTSDLLLLYALSTLNFVAFFLFAFIFLRSIVKLVRERRTFQLGAKIKTRLLIYFFAVSLLPIIAMAGFSYLFMNRGLERWFSQIPQNALRGARDLERSSAEDRRSRISATAQMLATTLGADEVTDEKLQLLAEQGRLSYIEVHSSGRTVAKADRPVEPHLQEELSRVIDRFRLGQDLQGTDDGTLEGAVASIGGGARLLIVPDPVTAVNVGIAADTSLAELERLSQEQFNIRRLGLLTLGLLTFLLIFASSWIAFYVARGLTTPIKALAEGADEIAKGNLGHRIDVLAEDELAILVNAFNDMSTQLDASAAELNERRRYIETVLESLPTGVISFDGADKVTTINRAALEILGQQQSGSQVLSLIDLDVVAKGTSLVRIVSRARRTGHATEQVTFAAEPKGPERTVSVTATKLAEDAGVVLVIEDLSELIAAQRSSAWQEVARRMAHEIKNPLTPIQLSAERIAKRFERAGHADAGTGKRIDDKGPIGEVVHESTATIIREVGSLKAMVDEFSRFARLPEAILEPGDVKEAIRQAVASVDGRFPGVNVEFAENGSLPPTMHDAEQIKRVFINLIDNAAESFTDDALERSVRITARHDAARELIVAEVADNGRGIDAADLQKLFMPYFSTKGRGTGLGLTIVKRIITDHKGRINVAANQPQGAKFIIELPVV